MKYGLYGWKTIFHGMSLLSSTYCYKTQSLKLSTDRLRNKNIMAKSECNVFWYVPYFLFVSEQYRLYNLQLMTLEATKEGEEKVEEEEKEKEEEDP